VTAAAKEDAAARHRAWGGEARAAFAGARDPKQLATAVVTFHARVDEVVAETLRGHGVKLACDRGCAYCCSMRVEVEPYEAFHLAAWLRRHFAPQRLGDVLARLRANAARARELGKQGRMQASIPCALLGEDGGCTAYEARPAQCRRYHSLDVKPCKTFHDDPTHVVAATRHEPLLHNAAVIITQARHAARDAGLRHEPVEMSVALLEALENPKAWKRWKDGKAPFPGVPA
jgi:hypothetical protein